MCARTYVVCELWQSCATQQLVWHNMIHMLSSLLLLLLLLLRPSTHPYHVAWAIKLKSAIHIDIHKNKGNHVPNHQ